MLERLCLRNFQRHENIRIVFDEQVTSFVGSSDLGKSSILRGLRWILTNKPSGSVFTQHGKRESIGSLWLDGRKIVRRKGKGVNELSLDGEKLEAFGSELPELVLLFCNVDEGNFQGQHDPPFWLSLTAGQAGRELNAVVDLDEIDRVLSVILKVERRAKTEAELCEKRAEEAEREDEALGWVPEMKADYDGVEGSWSEHVAAEEKMRRAAGLLREVEDRRRDSEVEIPSTDEIDQLLEEAESAEQKRDVCQAALNEVHRLAILIENYSKEMDELEKRLLVKSGGICPLCGAELKCLKR